MMNIYKVEGYGKHYSTNMMVLGNNFDDAKVVISEQTGIKVEEIEKCFYISLYANMQQFKNSKRVLTKTTPYHTIIQ